MRPTIMLIIRLVTHATRRLHRSRLILFALVKVFYALSERHDG